MQHVAHTIHLYKNVGAASGNNINYVTKPQPSPLQNHNYSRPSYTQPPCPTTSDFTHRQGNRRSWTRCDIRKRHPPRGPWRQKICHGRHGPALRHRSPAQCAKLLQGLKYLHWFFPSTGIATIAALQMSRVALCQQRPRLAVQTRIQKIFKIGRASCRERV